MRPYFPRTKRDTQYSSLCLYSDLLPLLGCTHAQPISSAHFLNVCFKSTKRSALQYERAHQSRGLLMQCSSAMVSSVIGKRLVKSNLLSEHLTDVFLHRRRVWLAAAAGGIKGAS
jgi:hypothetical protein